MPCALLGRTPAYKLECRSVINSLSDHFGRDLALCDLSDAVAAQHFQWLLDQGLSTVTVNRYRASWFAVWRHAHRGGLVGTEPKLPKLRVEHREPDAWSLEQLGAIFAAAARFQPGRQCFGIPRNLWWSALLRVAYWTALRRGSLFAIRLADVDLRTGWLSVQARDMKNRRAKTFKLGDDALEAIAAIRQPDRPRLFPRFDLHRVNFHFGLILADAEIPPSDRPGLNKFHAIRRTVATQAAIAGGVHTASALLGHSGEQVTKRYIDPRFIRGNDATAFLPYVPAAIPGLETCDGSATTVRYGSLPGFAE